MNLFIFVLSTETGASHKHPHLHGRRDPSYLYCPKEIILDYIIACVSLVDNNFTYAFIFDDAVKTHLW